MRVMHILPVSYRCTLFLLRMTSSHVCITNDTSLRYVWHFPLSGLIYPQSRGMSLHVLASHLSVSDPNENSSFSCSIHFLLIIS